MMSYILIVTVGLNKINLVLIIWVKIQLTLKFNLNVKGQIQFVGLEAQVHEPTKFKLTKSTKEKSINR